MRTRYVQQGVILGALAALVLLGVAAVLPHSHAGPAGSAPHACVLCRAQTAQPHVAPPVSIPPLFQRVSGVVLPATRPCLSLSVVALPETRAPPVVA